METSADVPGWDLYTQTVFPSYDTYSLVASLPVSHKLVKSLKLPDYEYEVKFAKFQHTKSNRKYRQSLWQFEMHPKVYGVLEMLGSNPFQSLHCACCNKTAVMISDLPKLEPGFSGSPIDHANCGFNEKTMRVTLSQCKEIIIMASVWKL